MLQLNSVHTTAVVLTAGLVALCRPAAALPHPHSGPMMNAVKSKGVHVQATFETPVVAYTAPQTHAWFSQVFNPGTGPLVLTASLSGDGTTPKCPGTCGGAPGPGGCPHLNHSLSCGMARVSTDHGRSWQVLEGWPGADEIIPLPSPGGGPTNGTFLSLPYRLTLNVSDGNRTATSINGYSRLDGHGTLTHTAGDDTVIHWTAPNGTVWPEAIVHTGTVIPRRDGSLLTTLYGHGSGPYRNWSAHSAVFFAISRDGGRHWQGVADIPWQAPYGEHSDGPAEPNTARLPNGTLWCVFRSDAMQNFWSAQSDDDGLSWHSVRMLDFAWSVRPQLRVTSQGMLVLTGGRPGIDLWASADVGATWTRFNIAAEHNRLLGGGDPALLYDPQVVNVTSPHVPRALPEPETSSYTGLTEAADGSLVLSYDRLANGWKDRIWAANGTLLPGCWGDADRVFTMRLTLTAQ
eukprot:m.200281 g.200281  ORF g.200281 m.200281 type:complete len:461 (+) comp21010_c0_seq1:141-1523(+)